MRRNEMVIRQWQILVLLRRGAKTLPQLADHFGTSERTIRRDLQALEAVPMPIAYEPPVATKGVPATWSLMHTPAWPKNEQTPIRELRA